MAGAAAIVARYARFSSFLCGGSLINDRYILTSARCVHMFPPDMLAVSLGSPRNLTAAGHRSPHVPPLLSVQRVIVHEKYMRFFRWRRKHVFNDVALLRLTDPIKLEDPFVPICLPTSDSKDAEVSVAGWGYTRPSGNFARLPYPAEAVVRQLDPGLCAQFYSRSLRYNEKSTICASPASGVCFRDEGTPLIARRNGYTFQTGLVSISRGFADCGLRPKVPTIFEKVTSHLEWIKSKTGDARWCWTPEQLHARKEEENEIKEDFFNDFKNFQDAKDVELTHRKMRLKKS